jgi:hypothetical protein
MIQHVRYDHLSQIEKHNVVRSNPLKAIAMVSTKLWKNEVYEISVKSQ